MYITHARFPYLSLIFLVSSAALPYNHLVIPLARTHCCSLFRAYNTIIDHGLYYRGIQFTKSHYNSSREMSYAGRTGGSSTMILVTVSPGSVDDNVSISGRGKVFAGLTRLVTEAELPRIVSASRFGLQRPYSYLRMEAASVVTLAATDVAVLATLRSPRSKTLSTVLAFRGMKRVQNKAIRIPRSITRCFRMKRMTRKKKARPAMMSSLSIRSAFSRAITSCFEVTRMLSSTS